MNTKDLKLPVYTFIDKVGDVLISKSTMSMDVVVRNKEGKVDHFIFADIVDHPDRITWKAMKGEKLSPMDKFILSNVLSKFQNDPSIREDNEQRTLQRLEYLRDVEHQEFNDLQKEVYELLKQ